MDFLGQQITVALVVSLVVQGVISILVFAAGIRVAKERSDRAALRTIYNSLFEHFKDLRDRMQKADPKRWRDYKMERGGPMPPMRDLDRNGDINVLPAALGQELLRIEQEALAAGERFHHALENDVAPKLTDFIAARVKTATLLVNTSGGYIAFTPSSALAADEKYISAVSARLGNETPRLGVGMRNSKQQIETKTIKSENLVEGTLPSRNW